MKELGKSVFNMQRFMILQLAVNPNTSHTLPIDYVYAWYKKIYPFFESGELHEDLEPYFKITKNQVDVLSKFLDDEWLKGNLYNFYELEEKYNSRSENPDHGFDRYTMIEILKYMRLRGGFDDDFWNKLLEQFKHPSEAMSIVSKFSSDDIYFV